MPEKPDENANDKVPFLKLVTEKCGDHVAPDPDVPAGVNDEAAILKITQLEQEHGDLDQAIHTLEERMPYDRLALQRMKKRKLKLKDEMTKLKNTIHPDIIA